MRQNIKHKAPLNKILEEENWMLYGYDDDEDYEYGCGGSCCTGIDYEYLPKVESYYAINKFRKVPNKVYKQNNISLIDMDSFYSKEMRRQKKIDEILTGSTEILPNTIENAIKYK